jgi:pimeloyl-ACP methyl ester carboxylesterase
VSQELEKHGTVFAYNRFGIDGSDKPTTPQSGRAIVGALRELLELADVSAPYVLVGHSLGGLYANLFARQHPREVRAVVLVEAAHPNDVEALAELRSPLTRALQRVASISVFGRNTFAEVEFVAATVREIAEAGPFPDVPLTVVTGAKSPPTFLLSPAARDIRLANQRDFLKLSTHARQVFAEKSGHFPQITEPALVAEAILATGRDEKRTGSVRRRTY